MKIVDKIFGEMEYHSSWYKYMPVQFMGKEYKVSICVSGEEDAVFAEGQYTAYEELWKKWDSFQDELLETIFNYYTEEKEAYGYEEEDGYPDIKGKEELLSFIELKIVIIDWIFEDGIRNIGIAFDCTWDEELGVGVKIENEEIVEVGTTSLIF